MPPAPGNTFENAFIIYEDYTNITDINGAQSIALKLDFDTSGGLTLLPEGDLYSVRYLGWPSDVGNGPNELWHTYFNEWVVLINSTLQSPDPAYAWSNVKIRAEHQYTGDIFYFHISDTAQAAGQMVMEIWDSTETTLEFSSETDGPADTRWVNNQVGLRVGGFYPVYESQSTAEAASPVMTASYYGQGRYLPDGLTAGVNIFYGTLGMASWINMNTNPPSLYDMVGTSHGVNNGGVFRSVYKTPPDPINGRSAIQFSGNGTTGAYAEVPHDDLHNFSNRAFTVSVWFKANQNGVCSQSVAGHESDRSLCEGAGHTWSYNQPFIWSKGDLGGGVDTASFIGLGQNINGMYDYISLLWRDSTGAVVYQIDSNNPLAGDDLWHHAVVTCSPNSMTDSTLRLFIDGSMQGEALVSNAYFTSVEPMYLGRGAMTAGGPINYYDGFVDNLIIFKTNLDSDDVLGLYAESIEIDPANIPTISLDQVTANLGDTLTVSVDLKGGTLEEFYWTRKTGENEWAVQTYPMTGGVVDYTITAADSSEIIRCTMKVDGNYYRTSEISIGDLSGQLEPFQKFGYWPLFGTTEEAELYPLGNGGYHTHNFGPGEPTFYMPEGLTLGVNSWHEDYGLHAYFPLDSDGIDTVSSIQLIGSGSVTFDTFEGRDSVELHDYSGTSGKLLSTTNNDLDIGSNSFTISFWANISADNTALLGKTAPDLVGYEVYGSGDKVRVSLSSVAGTTIDLESSPITHNVWTYISVVVDRENDEAILYIDGASQGAGPEDISSLGSLANNTPFMIGESFRGDVYSPGTPGLQIDDITFSSRAMDAEEVNYWHNAGIVGPPTVPLQVSMWDTYGDGWNSGSVTIKDDQGAVIATYTGPLAYGTGAWDPTLSVSENQESGQAVVVETLDVPDNAIYSWEGTNGQYPSEIGFQIQDPTASASEDEYPVYFQNMQSATQSNFVVGTLSVPIINAYIDSFQNDSVQLQTTFSNIPSTGSWVYRVDNVVPDSDGSVNNFVVGEHYSNSGAASALQSLTSTSPVSVAVTPGQNIFYVAAVDASGYVLAVSPQIEKWTVAVTLEMHMGDSYGDGWNSANFRLFDWDNVQVFESTLSSGSYQLETFQVDAALSADPVDPNTPEIGDFFWYITEGNYPYEISASLVRVDDGSVIFNVAPADAPVAGGFKAQGSFRLGPTQAIPRVTSTATISGLKTITLDATFNAEALAAGALNWSASFEDFGEIGHTINRFRPQVQGGTSLSLMLPNTGAVVIYLAAVDGAGVIVAKGSLTSIYEFPSIDFQGTLGGWYGVAPMTNKFIEDGTVGDTPYQEGVQLSNLTGDYDGTFVGPFIVQKYVGVPPVFDWGLYEWASGPHEALWVDIGPLDDIDEQIFYPRSELEDALIRAKGTLDSGDIVYSNEVNILGPSNAISAKYILSSDVKDGTGNYDGLNLQNNSFVFDEESARNVLEITNNSFELPHNGGLSGAETAYTISMWVKPDAALSGHAMMLMSDYQSGVADDYSFEIFMDDEWRIHVRHQQLGNGFVEEVIFPEQLQQGQWNQVSLFWEHENHVPYIEYGPDDQEPTGIWALINDSNQGPTAPLSGLVLSLPNARNLKIGDTASSGTIRDDGLMYIGFVGQIADILMWNRAQTWYHLDSIQHAAWQNNMLLPPTDNLAPSITLHGSLQPVVPHGSALPDFTPGGPQGPGLFGAFASDERGIDGYALDVSGEFTGWDVTEDIVMSESPINTFIDGNYTITYDITDEAGNAAPQVARVVQVRTFDQISNDDTSLDPASEASGWLTTGLNNIPGDNFHYYSDLDELSDGSLEPKYLIDCPTSASWDGLEQTKTYSGLDAHDYVRIRFKYYYMNQLPPAGILIDGVFAYEIGVWESLKPLSVPSAGQGYSSQKFVEIDFIHPHFGDGVAVGTELEMKIVSASYTQDQRTAFSPVEISLGSIKASQVQVEYSVDLSADDRYMVFLNGKFVPPAQYTVDNGKITFIPEERYDGELMPGDEITCVVVT